MSKDQISIKEYQEIDFNEDYINSSLNHLNNIKNNLEKVIKQSKQLEEKITEYFKKINYCFLNLKDEIESCISWFNEKDNFKSDKKDENIIRNNEYLNNIYKNFKECDTYIQTINKNNYIDKISELNKELQQIIKDIYDYKFTPPKSGEIKANDIIKLALSFMYIGESSLNDTEEPYSFFDNRNEITFNLEGDNPIYLKQVANSEESTYVKSIKKEKEENEEKEESNKKKFLKCTQCMERIAINKCSHCSELFCEGCTEFFEKFPEGSNHIFEKIPDNELDKEIAKDLFLKNFIEFIKYYLLKCDYLLKLKSSKFEYPSIKDINDLESQKNYIEQINKILKDNESNGRDDKKNN